MRIKTEEQSHLLQCINGCFQCLIKSKTISLLKILLPTTMFMILNQFNHRQPSKEFNNLMKITGESSFKIIIIICSLFMSKRTLNLYKSSNAIHLHHHLLQFINIISIDLLKHLQTCNWLFNLHWDWVALRSFDLISSICIKTRSNYVILS